MIHMHGMKNETKSKARGLAAVVVIGLMLGSLLVFVPEAEANKDNGSNGPQGGPEAPEPSPEYNVLYLHAKEEGDILYDYMNAAKTDGYANASGHGFAFAIGDAIMSFPTLPYPTCKLGLNKSKEIVVNLFLSTERLHQPVEIPITAPVHVDVKATLGGYAGLIGEGWAKDMVILPEEVKEAKITFKPQIEEIIPQGEKTLVLNLDFSTTSASKETEGTAVMIGVVMNESIGGHSNLVLPINYSEPIQQHEPPAPVVLVADVKVTNITFSNDNPEEGEEIIISATVWNNCAVDLTNITITFSYDMTVIKNITNLSIGAKENMTVNATWKAVKWRHRISVMASINGMPLKDSIMSKEITVEAKPIGDIQSLVIALIFIGGMIFGTTIVPSIFGKLKSE